jgi:hypothetical protein
MGNTDQNSEEEQAGCFMAAAESPTEQTQTGRL